MSEEGGEPGADSICLVSCPPPPFVAASFISLLCHFHRHRHPRPSAQDLRNPDIQAMLISLSTTPGPWSLGLGVSVVGWMPANRSLVGALPRTPLPRQKLVKKYKELLLDGASPPLPLLVPLCLPGASGDSGQRATLEPQPDPHPPLRGGKWWLRLPGPLERSTLPTHSQSPSSTSLHQTAFDMEMRTAPPPLLFH